MLARFENRGYTQGMYGTKPDGGTWQDNQRATSAVVAQRERAQRLEAYQNATRLPDSERLEVSKPTIFDAIKSLLQKGVPIAVLAPLLLAACGEAQATPSGTGGVNIEPTRAIVAGVHDPSRGEPPPTSTIAGTVIAVPAAPTREPTATIEPTATAIVASPTSTTRPAAPGTPATPGKPETGVATPVAKEIPKEIASNPFLVELFNKNGEGIPMLEIEGKEPIKAELDLHLKRYTYKDQATGEILAAYDHGPFPRIARMSFVEAGGQRLTILTDYSAATQVVLEHNGFNEAQLAELLKRGLSFASSGVTYPELVVNFREFGLSDPTVESVQEEVARLEKLGQGGSWYVEKGVSKEVRIADPTKNAIKLMYTIGGVSTLVSYSDPRAHAQYYAPSTLGTLVSIGERFPRWGNFTTKTDQAITRESLLAVGINLHEQTP